jgi:DNA helicase-2/ATP-dependent DNA helicase PcrA
MERWLETSIDGVIIGGKSDKLIFNGNHVTIVDYKTGNSKNAEKMFKPPGAKSLETGKLPPKYWFQLGIYHLIVNNQRDKNWKAEMSVIDSLERNDEGNFPLFKQTYSDEDLQLLRRFLEEGNKKLENLEFLTGCGKPDCEWCKFSKETGQAVVQIPAE